MEIYGQDRDKTYIERFLAFKIEPHWAKVMRELSSGLSSKVACEKAWWHCVWLVTEHKIQEMLEIRERIETDTPLTKQHFMFLTEHMKYGRAYISRFTYDTGNESYQIMLKPDASKQRILPLYAAAYTLLTQPAFRLARQLESKHSKPRFIKQCRAPSCGKLFYTGHKNAVVCKGTEGGKKSKCALEWVRYYRYLVKTRKKPEEDWNNQKLREEFLSYDKD